MLFSILIAHYNNFEYFKTCFESILNQTYQNFEIIIVDDCSTDNSLKKIELLTNFDKRVIIFKNEINAGVGYTKRKCVELSTGDICGFLDPDDMLTANALEMSIKSFTSEKITACYSQLYFCDENLSNGKIYSQTHQIKINDPQFLNINFEVAHFFTFRKSAYLKTTGINQKYRVAEDQDLIMKLYEQGEFKFIPEPLYYYRVHRKGLSHDHSKLTLRKNNWHLVLIETLTRRGIKNIHGRNVEDIENIPEYIFKKRNTISVRIFRKLNRWIL